MVLEDTVWYVPFSGAAGDLQSAYVLDETPAPGSTVIGSGAALTISLEAVRLAGGPHEPWFQRVLHPHTDVLILTSSALGSKPLVQRVHYYQTNIDTQRALLAHDMLSSVIWVCDDYQPPDAFYFELQVVTVDRSDEQRTAALNAFESLASAAGAIFPVALPYVALGDGLLNALNKLWDANERRETYRLSEPIKLFPPGTPRAKTLWPGRYVIFSQAIDGTAYQLGDNATLSGSPAAGRPGAADGPLSYAVVRVDAVKQVALDFVISQRVATLLTQLKNDQDGQPAGALQTSFGYLSETLHAYTNFTDLQRYLQLLRKGTVRTQSETEQMQQLEQRDELKPFLPRPT